MKQEDKDLLVKDLCARLPYGVIVKTPQGDGYLNEVSLTIFGHELGVNIKATERTCLKLEECKPYLRPMLSMTEEEIEMYHSYCKCDDGDFTGETLYFDTIESFDYLNSIHVDYRGLIPKDLAIEVTKENNPYKN